MAISTMQDLMLDQLGDVYDAEHRFLKGQQEMVQNATDQQLKSGIQLHIEQTQGHIQNLEQVFNLMGQQPKGVTCEASQGLVSEAKKDMQGAGSDSIRDVLIDGAALRVEHYEIAAYTALIAGAQLMGQQQAVSLLQQNLQQEQQTAQKLEQMTTTLLQAAMQSTGANAQGMTAGTMGATDTVTGTTMGASTMGQTVGAQGTAGQMTGDDYVKVDTSKASDILVDETQNQGTPQRQGS
jgi:ferritin-like metal-binding protein YciE